MTYLLGEIWGDLTGNIEVGARVVCMGPSLHSLSLLPLHLLWLCSPGGVCLELEPLPELFVAWTKPSGQKDCHGRIRLLSIPSLIQLGPLQSACSLISVSSGATL